MVWTGKIWIRKEENGTSLRRIDYVFEGAFYYLYICICMSVPSDKVWTNRGSSNFALLRFFNPLNTELNPICQ